MVHTKVQDQQKLQSQAKLFVNLLLETKYSKNKKQKLPNKSSIEGDLIPNMDEIVTLFIILTSASQ